MDESRGWWTNHIGSEQSYNASSIPSHIETELLEKFVSFCTNTWKNDQITLQDFILFIGRFGPIMSSIGKSTASFLDPVANSIYPWFHGLISRSQAESILQHDPDGSFIVRFSESQPLKFTLTYVKVHASGRREMKNCLLQNIGQNGYQLEGGGIFASIADFIQKGSTRLTSSCCTSAVSLEFDMEKNKLLRPSSYGAFVPEALFVPEAPALNDTYGYFDSLGQQQSNATPYGEFQTSDITTVPPPIEGPYGQFHPTDVEFSGALERGIAHLKANDFTLAIADFRCAVEFADEKFFRMRALGNLATALYEVHEYEEASENYRMAIELAREIGDREREVTLVNNITLSLCALERYDVALEYCHYLLNQVESTYNQNKVHRRIHQLEEKLNS